MLLNAALRVLPRVVCEHLVLGRIKVTERALSEVSIRVASTKEDVLGAARLVHDSYVRRGIMEPHPTGLKVNPQTVAPSSLTFVGVAAGQVIGTISLLVDSPLGLPMEGTYGDEVALFRARGDGMAEVSGLAVAPEWRKSGVFYLLNRAMARTAVLMRLDRIVMSAHPRARELYRAALLFETFGSERAYAGLDGAPAVAMTLPLADIRQRLHAAFAHLGSTPANAEYLYYDMPCPNLELPSLETARSCEARNDAHALLVRARMDMFRDLPRAQLEYLKSALPGVLWPSRSSADWGAELGREGVGTLATT